MRESIERFQVLHQIGFRLLVLYVQRRRRRRRVIFHRFRLTTIRRRRCGGRYCGWLSNIASRSNGRGLRHEEVGSRGDVVVVVLVLVFVDVVLIEPVAPQQHNPHGTPKRGARCTISRQFKPGIEALYRSRRGIFILAQSLQKEPRVRLELCLLLVLPLFSRLLDCCR